MIQDLRPTEAWKACEAVCLHRLGDCLVVLDAPDDLESDPAGDAGPQCGRAGR